MEGMRRHQQGGRGNPEYRSRNVAKDLKSKRDPNMPAIDSFAPMPALEMMKLLLSLAAMWRTTRRGGVLVIMVIDVRKAHLNGDIRRRVVIRIPKEMGGGLGSCAQAPSPFVRLPL